MKNVIMACCFLCALVLSSCNTIEGIGKDTESVGESIQKTANDAK
ncbi:entericidin A/B family lipoprotein [Prosthecochloris sp. ZM_2]|nr:entericidin A/B family lipoprotein [Prosthecochloris sp. ZM_2]